MLNNSGFVKFDRKILNWTWYTDVKAFKLFFHFVMTANYADGSFLGVSLKRGQLARSYSGLSKETGLTVSEIRTVIKKLKKTQEITQTVYPKFSVFTVVAYNKYQHGYADFSRRSQRNDTGLTQAKQSSGNIINNNKNNKNNNKKNNAKGNFTLANETVKLYHELCPSLPRVKNLTPVRIAEAEALNAAYGKESVVELFKKAEASDFLRGKNRNKKGEWRASFGWLINVENAAKVLDGLYDNPKNAEDERYNFEEFERRAIENLKDK